jgi:hypothetical protein
MIGSTVFALPDHLDVDFRSSSRHLLSADGRGEASSAPLRLGGLPLTRFPAGVSHFRSKPLHRNLLPRVFIVLTELLKKLV